MAEHDPQRPEDPGAPAADDSTPPPEARAADEDPIFTGWAEIRLTRAALFAATLLVPAAVLVLVFILLDIL